MSNITITEAREIAREAARDLHSDINFDRYPEANITTFTDQDSYRVWLDDTGYGVDVRPEVDEDDEFTGRYAVSRYVVGVGEAYGEFQDSVPEFVEKSGLYMALSLELDGAMELQNALRLKEAEDAREDAARHRDEMDAYSA